jgi:hypothetical protein
MAPGHLLQNGELETVGGGIVVGFADIDDARIAENCQHLFFADGDAGGEVKDLPHLRWADAGVGELGIAERGRGAAAHNEQEVGEEGGQGGVHD